MASYLPVVRRRRDLFPRHAPSVMGFHHNAVLYVRQNPTAGNPSADGLTVAANPGAAQKVKQAARRIDGEEYGTGTIFPTFAGAVDVSGTS
jgi:hypothetical protein